MIFNINFSEMLNCNFLNNSVRQYLFALFVFIGVWIVLKIFKKVIVKRLRKIGDHIKIEFYDLLIRFIDSIGGFFYFFIALYTSLQFVQLSAKIDKFFHFITLLVIAYYLVKGIQEILDYLTKKLIKKAEKGDEKFDPSFVDLLNRIIKLLLWIIAVIIVLQNLGYNVTTLVAGLGIGGVAIAFAFQNILSDIFSAFSLYFDKPFQVGDFIIIGNDMGTVKKIGIKSTRLATLQGQELVIPNKELTETRVNNYKKMKKRRIAFNFGVTYQTPTVKLKKIPRIIKKIVNRIELAKIDRVHFKEFADSSLNFEVVYYIDSNDYNKYMDVQQKINLKIKEEFENEGIEMAYPTQTIFVNR